MEMAHNKTIIKTHQKWLLVAQQQQTMLTVKQCRELLQQNEKELTDEEIIIIRDWLMSLADIAIEITENKRIKK